MERNTRINPGFLLVLRRVRVIRDSLVFAAATAASADGQNPLRHFTEGIESRFSLRQPTVNYLLTVNAGDTTGFDVQMVIANVSDTFRLAMAKHPEYDDRFFRFVENLTGGAGVTITREDSALWRVVAPERRAVIRYRIGVPAERAPRAAWRPFLSNGGALVGGPHAFMYIVGAELAPAYVQLAHPWPNVSTGLTPTADANTFYASNVYALVESPILVGHLHRWSFGINRVPHSVWYWSPRERLPFDTMAFVNGVERLVTEVTRLFGRSPYREYHFQFQDNAFGGLEHFNSVTIGAPSAELAETPHEVLPEIAHEFIHTWNLVRIRPAEYVGVDYRTIKPVPTLWFSEGLTMHYADIVLRRAKLPARDSTRTAHLEGLIARYLSQPGYSRFSAEAISRVAYNAEPDALGDYDASAHLVGEVIGSMLDIIVRDATDGRRSMDDVMRLMLERHGGEKGFTGADVESAVQSICACVVKPFFDAHVRGARALDFNRYLGLIGLRLTTTMQPVINNGQPAPDNRVWAWNPPNDSLLAVRVMNPETVWGRAGLHSGDRILSVNGTTPRTWPEFRQVVARARIGDTVTLVVRSSRAPAPRTVRIVVSGYERPVPRIEPLPGATEKQVRLRRAWLDSSP
jgi:predicted metalloprotease with PDZ domain